MQEIQNFWSSFLLFSFDVLFLWRAITFEEEAIYFWGILDGNDKPVKRVCSNDAFACFLRTMHVFLWFFPWNTITSRMIALAVNTCSQGASGFFFLQINREISRFLPWSIITLGSTLTKACSVINIWCLTTVMARLNFIVPVSV